MTPWPRAWLTDGVPLSRSRMAEHSIFNSGWLWPQSVGMWSAASYNTGFKARQLFVTWMLLLTNYQVLASSRALHARFAVQMPHKRRKPA